MIDTGIAKKMTPEIERRLLTLLRNLCLVTESGDQPPSECGRIPNRPDITWWMHCYSVRQDAGRLVKDLNISFDHVEGTANCADVDHGSGTPAQP